MFVGYNDFLVFFFCFDFYWVLYFGLSIINYVMSLYFCIKVIVEGVRGRGMLIEFIVRGVR